MSDHRHGHLSVIMMSDGRDDVLPVRYSPRHPVFGVRRAAPAVGEPGPAGLLPEAGGPGPRLREANPGPVLRVVHGGGE